MKPPPKTQDEINESKRLEALVLGEVEREGDIGTDKLLRRLDWYSSLERPNLSYVQARILCSQAAAKIRSLEGKG